MYCRNCGNQMGKKDTICTKCGVPAGKGNTHCPFCGAETHPEAVMCVTCGKKFADPQPEISKKSRALAGHLGIFFGGLGIHNFYLGYVAKGVAQILLYTLGLILCGTGPILASIWGFVEGIFILCDNINYDGYGKKFKK